MRLHKDRNAVAKRQAEAKARNDKWVALSHKEQLRVLDGRPGKSTRQRAKIQAQVNAQKEAHGKS